MKRLVTYLLALLIIGLCLATSLRGNELSLMAKIGLVLSTLVVGVWMLKIVLTIGKGIFFFALYSMAIGGLVILLKTFALFLQQNLH